MSDRTLKIVGVAMINTDNKTVFHQLGPASHTRLEDLLVIHSLYGNPKIWNKGFVASNGLYYSREEAFKIAKAADQLKDPEQTDNYLTSECINW